ncbi:MAG: Gfo/Idh/MocA family oxidoreductase [Chloroflexota bacterium]
MSKLRIGAIGCGYWGPNLIRNFIEIPEADLVAISDLQQDQLDRITTRYPQIEVATQNYRDFYDLELDGVVIATPPHTHYKIAMECMEHGLHAQIEKPITLNSDDAEKLTKAFVEKGLVLMVGHTFEYNPAVRLLKKMIDQGELGEIHYIDAVRASLGLFQTRANVLWDLAPHDISILRHILGADPISVSATGSDCVQEGIEDVAYGRLNFPNKISAHIRTSWLDPLKTRRITVVGSKKMVIYDDVEPHDKIKIYDKGVTAIRRTETFGEFHFAYHYGDVISPYIRFEEPLRLQCQHFLECIQDGKTPLTDGRNGTQVVKILEAMQHSMENNGKQVALEQEKYSQNGLVHKELVMA